MLAAAVTAAVAVPAATATRDWTPFYPLLGSWSGTREGSDGRVNVSRDYESVAGNQHLHITEKASKRQPWGLVSFDDASGAFVLRRFASDGGETVLVLEPVTGDGATLVFASPPGVASGAERITLERRGWDEFVERVEVAAQGTDFSLVAETRFRRKR